MKEFFLFGILILIPLYMVFRGLSVILPILVNSYRKESFQFYNNWNSNRILWMLSLILLVIINSWFFGKKFFNIDLNYDNFAECFVVIFLQVILLILFEFKMDNPFRPLKAYKYFRKKSFDENFVFKNQTGTKETILLHSEEIKKEIQNSKECLSEEILQQKNVSQEIHQLTTENNQLLKTSDFDFEIRNTEHLILADVMDEYYIGKTSEQVLSDFLLRKKKSGKIVFIKKPTNGVAVRPVFDFFSKFTDLFERCKKKEITETDDETKQVEAIKIINEIVLATDKDGKQVENPIDNKNFSKYLN